MKRMKDSQKKSPFAAKDNNRERLLISIVIPVHNGADTISTCLDHLENCDYPRERYEIIVVDNNSTDNTGHIVKKRNVQYCFEPEPGAAAARNSGARIAKGDILGFVDADCLVDKTWIGKVEKSLANTDVAAIVGLRQHVTRNVYDVMQSMDYQKYWADELSSGRPLNKICGSNSAIRKKVFQELGGFDQGMSPVEDIELGFRIAENGYLIEHKPDVKVKHIYLDTLDSLLGKTSQHGYHEYQCYKKHENHPNVELLMPAFHRPYFRILHRSKNRLIIKCIVDTLTMSISVLSFLLRLLLDHNVKNYPFYKTVLNLSLFKGKLAAILDTAGQSLDTESHGSTREHQATY